MSLFTHRRISLTMKWKRLKLTHHLPCFNSSHCLRLNVSQRILCCWETSILCVVNRLIGSYSLPLSIKSVGDTEMGCTQARCDHPPALSKAFMHWVRNKIAAPSHPSWFFNLQLAVICLFFFSAAVSWLTNGYILMFCLLSYSKGLQRVETNISHFVLTRMTSPFHLYGCLVVLMYLLEWNLSRTSVSGCGRWLQK